MVELSVILPVHNEAKIIVRTLEDICSVVDSLKIKYELICVENGSRDNSLEIIKKYASENPRVKLIRSDTGWGNAVRSGVKRATGEAIIYMVSDGQIDARVISRLYRAYISNTEPKCVLWKICRTSRESTIRLINSRIYNLISRVLFGVKTMDVNATPKLINTEFLKKIPLTATNIAIDLELMVWLQRHGYSWIEYAVESKKRDFGESTTKLKTIGEMLNWMGKIYNS